MSDENKQRTPSTSNSETAKPEPVVDADQPDGQRNQSVFGSEGSGGGSTPARPHERKKNS